MPGSARAGSRQANAKACDMASKPINAGAANKSKAHDMTSKTINAGAQSVRGRAADKVAGSTCRIYRPQC